MTISRRQIDQVGVVVEQKIDALIKLSAALETVELDTLDNIEGAMSKAAHVLAHVMTVKMTVSLAYDRVCQLFVQELTTANHTSGDPVRSLARKLNEKVKDIEAMSYTVNEFAKMVRVMYEGKLERIRWEKQLEVDGRQTCFTR